MRNIIIVNPGSTGYNYIEDIVRRGYRPVVLETKIDLPPEVMEQLKDEIEAVRTAIFGAMYHQPTIISEQDTFEATVALVKEYAPVVILPGSEPGVSLANRLGEALGLPANPTRYLPAMIRKDGMHEALKEAGLRYIRGRIIKSPREALAFCEEYGLETAVVKPLQSAGSQGLFLCDSREETAAAVEKILTMADMYGHPIREALVQERIVGREYVVNTVSAAGVHRVNSLWVYTKEKTSEGGFVYDSIETIGEPDAVTNELVNYAFKAADAIHFRNGIIHGEYMVDERGPVLIEVNCRPMGGSTSAEFLDRVLGQHETDAALDAVLDPAGMNRTHPCRVLRQGCMKFIIVPHDIHARDYPLWEIARHLKSVFKLNARAASSPAADYPKTRDMETSGGTFFMVHDDARVVQSDLEILRRLERHYFRFLLSDGERPGASPEGQEPVDFAAVIRDCHCHGAILAAADAVREMEGAQSVSPETLADAHKGFDYVIIAYGKCLSSLSESRRLRLLFDTMELVKDGGKVIITAETCRCITYGHDGAQMLMRVKGLRPQMLKRGSNQYVVGTAEAGI